jgi:hypothetical protein
VIDFATSTRQRSQQSGDAKVATDRPLHIVLSHDGKRAQLQCEGRPDQYVPAAMRTRGNAALYWMADTTNKIDKLSIEGRLAPGSLADLCKEANQLELFKIFGE